MHKNKKSSWRLPRDAVFAIIISVFSIITVGSIVVLEKSKPSPDMLELWKNIVLSILCSVAASVIFILLQKSFTRDEHKELTLQLDTIEAALQRQSELYDSGIISIRPKSYFDNEDNFWRDIINNTEGRLDLMGHSLSKWFYPEYKTLFCNKIKAIAESDKEVRIVLSTREIRIQDVYLVYWGKLDKGELTRTEKSILNFLFLAQEIDEAKRQNLKLFVVDLAKVTYMYIRTDHQSIISPYIFSPTNSQNTFLLELQSGTKYARTFEDDFREIVEEIPCLDLSPKEESYLEQIRYIESENQYSGNGWNFESTRKYLYHSGCMRLEAGYFEHYLNSKFVKAVIELPVSYGCPAKCGFCASSIIQTFQPLHSEQMMKLFEDLYNTHQASKRKTVLVSLTGMGDIYFNPDHVIDFLLRLSSYRNLQITLSSCLWNKALLEKVSRLEPQLTIRNIQITFVSDKSDVLSRVMPVYAGKTPDFDEILNFIKTSDKQYYRFNYILIDGLNDSEEDFQRLNTMLADVKDKVIVRISRLNKTNATEMNGLSQAASEKAEQLSQVLQSAGIKNYMFYAERNDNMNCGQLVTESN